MAHAVYTNKPSDVILKLLETHPDAIDQRVTFDGFPCPMYVLAAMKSQHLDVVYSITRVDPHFQEAVNAMCGIDTDVPMSDA